MKARTALPLPRYTRRKRLANGVWSYFFSPPSWAKKAGCPVHPKALGVDYESAVVEAETVLLPQFDSWRTGGASDVTVERSSVGTFDWLSSEFKQSRQYTSKDRKTRQFYDQGLSLVANHITKKGRRFGEVQVSQINQGVADLLYERLQVVTETVDGEIVVRHRISTANAAMKACRRAWNIARRKHPTRISADNPFSKMGLTTKTRETPAATYQQLLEFVGRADLAGRSSLGTAAMVAWEWAQREEHIFSAFMVDHYKPKDRPDRVRVVHPKNGEEAWIPLYDEDEHGDLVELYPELTARLDAIRRSRIAGLMIVRDWRNERHEAPVPWSTSSGDLTYMRHEVKRLILEAGLPSYLTFASFRHGGVTEASDSDATEEEIRSVTRHKTVAVLPRYSKRTMRKVANQAKKRRVTRTKTVHLSE